MNLMRKAAIASSSTILLTVAGAVTGIGSSAAQAYEIYPSASEVTLVMTAQETQAVAAGDNFAASQLCVGAISAAKEYSLFTPIQEYNCALAVGECSGYAAGRPATIVFRWDFVVCRY